MICSFELNRGGGFIEAWWVTNLNYFPYHYQKSKERNQET